MPGRSRSSRLRELMLAALFAAMTSILAFVTIPLPLVPITGQTFGVMLSGALLGARTGALSQTVYLFLGFAGLPVFAGGASGPGAFAGPSGGYLWGFVAGAFVIGLLVDLRKESGIVWKAFALAVGGILVVYAFGVTQLALVTGRSAGEALAVGAYPFLAGDVIKVAVAAVVTQKIDLRRVRPRLREVA